jgi:hypothetical protein
VGTESAGLSPEEELTQLARLRDDATQAALDALLVDPPRLLRQIRHYLKRQTDYRRFSHLKENAIELTTITGGLQELACKHLEFSSGSELKFCLQLEPSQRGTFVRQFYFHVKLARPRPIGMVRIHLNPSSGRDPLSVPRCHLHVDHSRPHVPFPIFDPRLILQLVCEHIEPDIGRDPESSNGSE